MSGKLAKRIREIERRVSVGAVEVILTDGRRLHIRDPLKLLVESFERRYAMDAGEPFPPGEYSGALDMLIESAPAGGCPERLIYTAFGILTSPAAKLTPAEEEELAVLRPGESPHASLTGAVEVDA